MTENSTGALVNSIYPLSYFTLSGVSKIDYPDKFWWASKERYASVDSTGYNYLRRNQGGLATSEILELDFGRMREVNYLNFDINRAPIDITIEYDALSTPNRVPVWKPVQATSIDHPYDDSVGFDPKSRNAWRNVEFSFLNEHGELVHTRYLRITFTRRDENWPTAASPAFQWPIFVKHLRTGRYVAELGDTAGPLLNQDTPNILDEFVIPALDTTTTEVRQQFVIPASSVRVGVVPNLLGFGVLVSPNTVADGSDADVVLQWSLYDATDPSLPAVRLTSGTTTPRTLDTQEWVDFYIATSKIITGSTDTVYELRIQSNNPLACNTVFTHKPNILSSTTLPGTLDFTHGNATVNTSEDLRTHLKAGQYIALTAIADQPLLVSAVGASTVTLAHVYAGTTASTSKAIVVYPFTSWVLGAGGSGSYARDAERNLVMRVWADIADEGKDVLGNPYRYLTRRQEASHVIDPDKPGWMSAALPTPEAVEALYFDVRTNLDFSLIQALEIAPRTPGVRMNVYYSQENVHGNAPSTTDEWDNLLWTPIQETYTLRRKEVINLPSPIQAAFVKLEFTALNPLPFRLPDYPPLPPKQYRRFPTWVEDQFNNSELRVVIDDWFVRNSTPVERKVLQDLADPVKEYEHKQADFLAQLALGTITDQQIVNSDLIDVANKTLIDPTTGSKIYVNTPDQYGNPLLVSVDQDSILGKMAVLKYDPTMISQPVEDQDNPTPKSNIPSVSTVNDRVTQSYQSLAQTPMRFNKTCRHIYNIEQAEFNKSAYFVGIDSVRFLRLDYGQAFDDVVITESLYDDTMLVTNTWIRETETSIPSGSTVYISYQVGDSTVIDEVATLSGFLMYELQTGGAPARNILIFSAPGRQGNQYYQGLDYQIGYSQDGNGKLTTFIERSPLTQRLGTPISSTGAQDSFTVVGHGRASSTDSYIPA